MAKYFNFFPNIYYNLSDNKAQTLITNLTVRFSFEEKLKQNSVAFYRYRIKDGETPEMLANKFYGSPEKHWIILLMNNMIDPFYDWVLDDRTFNEYVKEKYSEQGVLAGRTGLEWAKSNVHSRYKVVTLITESGTTVEEFNIDLETYNETPDQYKIMTLQDGNVIEERITKKEKTYFQYEQEINESKRTIKVLKSDFLGLVESEFESVFNE